MTPLMHAAVSSFSEDIPAGCRVDPKEDKPIYTLVKVDQWPAVVHYEFRAEDELLCVELHIEHRSYKQLGETFRRCAEELKDIRGCKLEYHERRKGRHWKAWPSLSIRLPAEATGDMAAAIMRDLINATRAEIRIALTAHERDSR